MSYGLERILCKFYSFVSVVKNIILSIAWLILNKKVFNTTAQRHEMSVFGAVDVCFFNKLWTGENYAKRYCDSNRTDAL